MVRDLLLEIGMEEIPARFIRAAVEQLAERVTKWLGETRIDYASITPFATPRRIAVLVTSVADKQQDIHEETKGPSKKIALDETGEWSKAALGFAKSQGVEPASLFFKELSGVEYVYALKNSIGVDTQSLLSAGLTQIIKAMTFPKNMRWGSQDLKFVRPIRWLAVLYGHEVIPLEIAGVSAGRVSRGHRFLGKEVELQAAADYKRVLQEQYVYVNIPEREKLILDQIRQLGEEKGWNISIKEDLLEEVLFLVEFPTVLFGSFHPDFLQIPQDVLITSMREHQRYFPVFNDEGALLPYFVTVRNGNSTSLEQVAKGNEKVLRARLSDAKFFYQEDQKMPIDRALARLETIVFHEELGTVGDKVRRIGLIARHLAKALQADAQTSTWVERSAEICKFDLVSLMVYEFPELQGVMGEDYARKAGENEAVAKAVFEHYQPRFSGDKAPASRVGAIISIADKIDTIVGCFSIGIIPTGSQDPYALRRQAAGIIQILLEHSFNCGLTDLYTMAIDVHTEANLLKRSGAEIRKDLQDFFALRIKNVLSEQQIRYDVIDAVMAAGFDNPSSVVRRAFALMNQVQSAQFKTTVEAFNRVNNLSSKSVTHEVLPSLFEHAAEQELYSAWQSTHALFTQQLHEEHEAEALQSLSGLKEPITRFFDAVMVMAEDAKIRNNRLALLFNISSDLKPFADFSKLLG